jgi:hypothetical protein
MIQFCKDYLTEILGRLQVKKIYDDLSDLGRNRFPTPAVFVYPSEDEDLSEDGTLVSKEDDLVEKMRYYKVRKYKVVNYIYLLFVAKTESEATQLRNRFLAELKKTITDNDNNQIDIKVNKSTLHLSEDILKKKVARELLLEFEGGIYTTRRFKLIDKFNPQEESE